MQNQAWKSKAAALAAAFLLWTAGVRLQAAPQLSTIQDVLYKADGTKFSGVAFIEWKSFQAADNSNIATQSVTVPIVDGVLRVRLVPTANASAGAHYTIRYSADGRIQFTENWNVPASSVPLRLKDVRSDAAAGGIIAPAALTITDITGLQSALDARPAMALAYANSRALKSNATGSLEAVQGNLTDCVKVDGTSGPCGSTGSSGPAFNDAETPAGLINGSNSIFTLAASPTPAASLQLYRNGVLQKASADYTLSANTITFTAASRPQTGDLLLASYRLPSASSPSGLAGGALTGAFPSPQIAAGAITNLNVATSAGIAEAKLALNFATHSSANDPTAGQKAAFTGTAGPPSAGNKFVTDQDIRLSNARPPAGHALLGTEHSDVTPGTVSRGDVLSGQSGPAGVAWTRLPLGAANRCLMSNGADAVWNTCLFTAFPAGSLAFTDSSGNLAENHGKLFWDDSNTRLSIGNNLANATLHVHDSTPATGTTTLAVRGGQGQGSSPLQQWLDAGGTEVGRVGADGAAVVKSVSVSPGSSASWRDGGVAADPASRLNGDGWYNSTLQARKSQDGGQAHPGPQVICSASGTLANTTSLTMIGSCSIPAAVVQPGDRFEIRATFSHEGGTQGFAAEVRWGATTLHSRTLASGDGMAEFRLDGSIISGLTFWSAQSWGAVAAMTASGGTSPDAVLQQGAVSVMGRLTGGPSADSVTLRNILIVRYPAQVNP